MTGKHEIHAILRSVEGVVGFMSQKDHGLIWRGQGWHSFVQLGKVFRRTSDSGKPEVRAVALDRKRAVGQRRNAVNLKRIDHDLPADQRVVIAERGKAMRTLNAAEDLRARIAEARAEMPGLHPVGDKVAGEHDNLGMKRIDAADHFAYERWLGVFVVMDIADLHDAQTVEGLGQAAQADGLLDDFEIVPVPETGIRDEATAGGE